MPVPLQARQVQGVESQLLAFQAALDQGEQVAAALRASLAASQVGEVVASPQATAPGTCSFAQL